MYILINQNNVLGFLMQNHSTHACRITLSITVMPFFLNTQNITVLIHFKSEIKTYEKSL